MRGKRSKQYRKLINQYALTFGIREPYQVIVDAEMLQESRRFQMDLTGQLGRTLHGEIKPMITQCSIRHLYALPVDPSLPNSITPETKTALLDLSRSLTLRRCGHHQLPEPLSPLECISNVLDPKDAGVNKFHLILATQNELVREWARKIPGVPSIYLRRSVMIMEPMSNPSTGVRQREERGKLRAGAKKGLGAGKKRKRENEWTGANEVEVAEGRAEEAKTKKKRIRGPKEPNPLSVKKKKTAVSDGGAGGMEKAGEKEVRGDVACHRPRKRIRKSAPEAMAVVSETQ